MALPQWLTRPLPVPTTVAIFAGLAAAASPLFVEGWRSKHRQDTGWKTRNALEQRLQKDARFARVAVVPMSQGVTVICGQVKSPLDLAGLRSLVHSTAPAAPVTFSSMMVGNREVPDGPFRLPPGEFERWLEESLPLIPESRPKPPVTTAGAAAPVAPAAH